MVPLIICNKSLKVLNRYCCGKYCDSPFTFLIYTFPIYRFAYVKSLLKKSIIQVFSSSQRLFLGRPWFSCNLTHIWYLNVKFWIISTFFLGLYGRWLSALFKLQLRACFAEKDDKFCGVKGTVFSWLCHTSDDCDWLLEEKMEKNQETILFAEAFILKIFPIVWCVLLLVFLPLLFPNLFFHLFGFAYWLAIYLADLSISRSTVFPTSWS